MPARNSTFKWRTLVIALMVVLLAACGGDEDDDVENPTAPPDDPTPTQTTLDPEAEYAAVQADVDFPLFVPMMDDLELVNIRIAGPDEQPVVNSIYRVGSDEDRRLSLFQSPGPVQHGMSGEIESVEVNGVEAEYSQDVDGLGQETHDLTWMDEGRQ